MLNGFGPEQSTVRQANATATRDVLDIEEEDACHFVDKEETDGGHVEKEEQQQRGHNGNANARLRNVRKEFDKTETEQPALFHVGRLQAVFWQLKHPVRVDKHVGVVGQQRKGKHGVRCDERHHDQVEVDHLSDELLSSVGHVVVEGGGPTLGDLFRRLFEGVP